MTFILGVGNIKINTSPRRIYMTLKAQTVPDSLNDKIIIRDGQVAIIQKWAMWESKPQMIFQMSRKGELFEVCANDPEHDKLTKTLPLHQAVAVLFHSGFLANLIDLFELPSPTINQIDALGFSGYYIIHS